MSSHRSKISRNDIVWGWKGFDQLSLVSTPVMNGPLNLQLYRPFRLQTRLFNRRTVLPSNQAIAHTHKANMATSTAPRQKGSDFIGPIPTNIDQNCIHFTNPFFSLTLKVKFVLDLKDMGHMSLGKDHRKGDNLMVVTFLYTRNYKEGLTADSVQTFDMILLRWVQ